MVRAIPLQFRWLVDQAILVAQVRLDGAQIIVGYGFRVIVKEDASPGLRGQLRQCLRAGGKAVFRFCAKGVDSSVGVLADIDCLFKVGVAGVIFAIGEEQDKVPAGGVIDSAKLVETSLVDSGENRCAPIPPCPTVVTLRIPAVSAAGLLVQGCGTSAR